MTFDVEKYVCDLHEFLSGEPVGSQAFSYEFIRRLERFICYVASKARREAFREALARARRSSAN